MQINEIIPATLLVRRAMQFHGRIVYSNKYDSCRTVKCYRPRDPVKEVELVDDIRSVLARAGYSRYSIKTTKGTKWGGPGLIVRLPFAEFRYD